MQTQLDLDNDERIEIKYEKQFKQLGETSPLFPYMAKKQMLNMVEQISKSNEVFEKISTTNQTEAVKAGFLAEEWHTETHNLDATLNNDSTRVYNDNYEEWYKQGYSKNDVPDLIAVKNDETVHESQLKYYKNADKTAKAMRDLDRDGNVKYSNMDSLVGPSDQVTGATGKSTIQEEAQKTVNKENTSTGRANVKKAAQDVFDKAIDKIKTGKSKSKPLSKKEAEQLAKNHKKSKYKNDIENEYKTKSTTQQIRNAAVGAAAMAAVTSGVTNTIRYCQMAKEGKISEKEAVYKILAETVSSSADSAIKAGSIAGSHSLIVRYGSKKLIEKMTEQSLRGMMRTNVVTVGVICGIDAIKDLVKLGTGKITQDEFYERQGKGMLNTGSGVVGGSLGFSVGTSVATSLGFASGSTGLVAIGAVGGVAGGLIAGLAMQLAIENHIEKAYSDMIRNTDNLNQSLKLLSSVSNNIYQGQIVFKEFLKEEQRLNQSFENHTKRLNDSGKKMSSAIDLI
jgi:hypothetical protein